MGHVLYSWPSLSLSIFHESRHYLVFSRVRLQRFAKAFLISMIVDIRLLCLCLPSCTELAKKHLELSHRGWKRPRRARIQRLHLHIQSPCRCCWHWRYWYLPILSSSDDCRRHVPVNKFVEEIWSKGMVRKHRRMACLNMYLHALL